jgi:hypothetical protein
MKTKLKLTGWMESCDGIPLGGVGANVRQLTSAPAITGDIYCEQPYCSADGTRLAMLRSYRVGPGATSDLLSYDIPSYRISLLESNIIGIANAAWSGVLFVTVQRGKSKRLVKFDLNTMEREDLFSLGSFPPGGFSTVSADNRYGLGSARLKNGKFGIYRLDLRTGKSKIVHESPDIANPHLQFRLYTGSRILIQENRGAIVDKEGNWVRPFDPARGVGLYSIAADGSDRKDFPVGPPHTAHTTGHECWIGNTDHVLVTVSDYHDDGKHRGTLLECSHDWPKPRVVSSHDHRWNHISATKCGRYFVTDTYEDPGKPIIVGSIRTGKWKVLCEGRTTGGGAQFTHLHPYMTSDNKWVVFNSDRTGVPQVYIAEVPKGLLESLD